MLLTEYPKAVLDQSHCVPHPQSRSWGNFREGNFHLSNTFQSKTPVCLLEHAGSSEQDVPCLPSSGTAELCSPPSTATTEIRQQIKTNLKGAKIFSSHCTVPLNVREVPESSCLWCLVWYFLKIISNSQEKTSPKHSPGFCSALVPSVVFVPHDSHHGCHQSCDSQQRGEGSPFTLPCSPAAASPHHPGFPGELQTLQLTTTKPALAMAKGAREINFSCALSMHPAGSRHQSRLQSSHCLQDCPQG